MDHKHATHCMNRAVHARDVLDATHSRLFLLLRMTSCHLLPTIMESMDIHLLPFLVPIDQRQVVQLAILLVPFHLMQLYPCVIRAPSLEIHARKQDGNVHLQMPIRVSSVRSADPLAKPFSKRARHS